MAPFFFVLALAFTAPADYLGAVRPPPSQVISDIAFRRTYYHSSYRFVKFLVERAGLETFMKLYDSENPEDEYARLYGLKREELVALAGSR